MSAQAFSECLGSVFHVIYHYGVKLLHGLGFILHLLKSAISSCRQWVSRALTYDQQRRRRIKYDNNTAFILLFMIIQLTSTGK